MKKPLIKIYGERNTGTNYLHRLIELNLDVSLLPGVAPNCIKKLQNGLPGHELLLDIYFNFTFLKNLGWKHSLVKPVDIKERMKIDSKKIFFITLTKNPYSWLLSLYKRPHHYRHNFNMFQHPIIWILSLYKRPYHYSVKKSKFESFLTSSWITVERENSQKEIENPIVLWNQKNESYIKLNDHFTVINLTYEDLLLSPEKVIEEVNDNFNLRRKTQQFRNLEESTKGDKKNFTFYQKYYLEEQWKEELSHESINIINKYLDKYLLNYYHYENLI